MRINARHCGRSLGLSHPFHGRDCVPDFLPSLKHLTLRINGPGPTISWDAEHIEAIPRFVISEAEATGAFTSISPGPLSPVWELRKYSHQSYSICLSYWAWLERTVVRPQRSWDSVHGQGSCWTATAEPCIATTVSYFKEDGSRDTFDILSFVKDLRFNSPIHECRHKRYYTYSLSFEDEAETFDSFDVHDDFMKSLSDALNPLPFWILFFFLAFHSIHRLLAFRFISIDPSSLITFLLNHKWSCTYINHMVCYLVLLLSSYKQAVMEAITENIYDNFVRLTPSPSKLLDLHILQLPGARQRCRAACSWQPTRNLRPEKF
jgi:hypothetical protein